MEAVLVCHNPRLGQVVIDALHANGIKPWLVLDPTTASSLLSSRLIRGVLVAKSSLRSHVDEIVDSIKRLHRPVDVVLASDVDGLLILAGLRDQLGDLLYPQPDIETLTLLNDKWAFRKLCERLALPTPNTVYFSSKSAIDPDFIQQEIGFPAVLKPTSQFSSIGIRIVASKHAMMRIVDDPAYQFNKLIVQEYVDGPDVGLSLFARQGKVIAATTFNCGENEATEFRVMPDFLAMSSRIVAETGYTGVANFDARVDPSGTIRLLECNPRFFIRLTAVRLCGLDLLRLGLTDSGIVEDLSARGSYYAKSDILTWTGIRRVITGQWHSHIFLKSWREALNDPLPIIRRRMADFIRR